VYLDKEDTMQKFNTLSDAIALAEFAHRNQLDKAGLPYIEHPRRVLAKVQAQGALPYLQQAAILHDVIEDTPFTGNMLASLGFSEATIRVVWEVSRNNGREGDDYYRLMSPDAKIIKRADIEDNLSPWRLAYLTEEKVLKLQAKYAHALEIINA